MQKCDKRNICVFCTVEDTSSASVDIMSIPLCSCVLPFLYWIFINISQPSQTHSGFYLSSVIWTFPLTAHPAASPAALLVFSHIIVYKIQIPVMDKSAWADVPEYRLLLSINVSPGDCVLLGCMTLWGPFGGPTKLQWLQSLKVNFWHWSTFCNQCSAAASPFIPPYFSHTQSALTEEWSHFHLFIPQELLSIFSFREFG